MGRTEQDGGRGLDLSSGRHYWSQVTSGPFNKSSLLTSLGKGKKIAWPPTADKNRPHILTVTL